MGLAELAETAEAALIMHLLLPHVSTHNAAVRCVRVRLQQLHLPLGILADMQQDLACVIATSQASRMACRAQFQLGVSIYVQRFGSSSAY